MGPFPGRGQPFRLWVAASRRPLRVTLRLGEARVTPFVRWPLRIDRCAPALAAVAVHFGHTVRGLPSFGVIVPTSAPGGAEAISEANALGLEPDHAETDSSCAPAPSIVSSQ